LRYQGRVKQDRYNVRFASDLNKKYYFVPLQVHTDSQITQRSEFNSIEEFIDRVVDSFVKNAPAGTRVNLPLTLRHCLGCVTINSSVGLSAIIHRKKTICLGESAFDLDGLTYQGDLDKFWQAEFEPAKSDVDNLLKLLKYTSQAQGVFFQRLYNVKGHSKIVWPSLFTSLFHSTK